MNLFMEMMEETEEQVTYSITLESLAIGNGETNGENIGGGGTDGETGRGGNTIMEMRTIGKQFVNVNG